jgi:hypothetical protein
VGFEDEMRYLKFISPSTYNLYSAYNFKPGVKYGALGIRKLLKDNGSTTSVLISTSIELPFNYYFFPHGIDLNDPKVIIMNELITINPSDPIINKLRSLHGTSFGDLLPMWNDK